jgi:ankyrin repeat protein
MIEPMARTIPTRDPLAVAAVSAVHSGDLVSLTQLLADNPDLATVRIGGDVDHRGDGGLSRTLLHVVTDWPGHYPNGAGTVAALVSAGADVNATFVGGHSETPLHWAASSDDVAVLDALLDAGADMEVRGGCIADGTPLFDATVFGQWQAARRLVERGARCGLWEAAALGDLPRLRQLLGEEPERSPEQINGFFWAACHGGQRATAEYLLAQGADLNWLGWDNLTPTGAARRSGADALVAWLGQQGAS